MNKKYIYKVNLLIEGDSENDALQERIDQKINEAVNSISDKTHAEFVSVQIVDLSNHENYGMCENCHAWASDFSKEDKIEEFSNGAVIDEKWYCDVCLPELHKNHF